METITNLDVFYHKRKVGRIALYKNNLTALWILSPAYDLTFSYSFGGEHATTVHGNGKNPEMADILEVAKSIGMNLNSAKIIAKDVRECVNEKLGLYLKDKK